MTELAPDVRVADAAQLPWADGSVDLVVCSPPYGLGVPYLDGGDIEPVDYWPAARHWAREMRRVVRPQGGRLALNIAMDTTWCTTFYADWTRLLAEAGWSIRHNITWNESNISRRTAWGSWLLPSAPHLVNPTEMIVVCHVGAYKRPAQGRRGDILPAEQTAWSLAHWSFPGANARAVGHPAPFPDELPRRLIKLYSYPGDVVADPFVGSGTTAVVAARLGRRPLAADRSPSYVAMTRAALAGALPAAA